MRRGRNIDVVDLGIAAPCAGAAGGVGSEMTTSPPSSGCWGWSANRPVYGSGQSVTGGMVEGGCGQIANVSRPEPAGPLSVSSAKSCRGVPSGVCPMSPMVAWWPSMRTQVTLSLP